MLERIKIQVLPFDSLAQSEEQTVCIADSLSVSWWSENVIVFHYVVFM